MKRLYLDQLKPGHVVAEAVCNSRGIAILQAGTVLTSRYIERLRDLGILSISVKADEKAGGGPLEAAHIHHPLPQAEGRSFALTDINSFIRHYLHRWSDDVLQMRLPAGLDERFPSLFNTIILEIVSQSHIVGELGHLWSFDRYLFEHSLHVAVYAGMLGMAVGYDRVKLQELIAGALLFDIGMTHLPQSLVKKEGLLTDEERKLLKTHTTEGCRRLLGKGVSNVVAQCALQHHERFDGTGYPFALKGVEISQQAQIVSICDVYDALLSPRHHRNAYTESETLEFLFASGHSYFHTDMVKLFLRYVASYPESRAVLLSSGQIGLVTASCLGLPHRPVIRIIRESDGTPVIRPYEINLLHKPELNIVHSLENVK